MVLITQKVTTIGAGVGNSAARVSVDPSSHNFLTHQLS